LFNGEIMAEPTARRLYWPDAMGKVGEGTAGLKEWSWAEQRLEKSHNYWIATSGRDGAPHLMVVWGIWWNLAFWFTTGPRTRKAKNLAAQAECVIGTEKADEAVILQGTAEEIRDRTIWKTLAEAYDKKYGGSLLPLLESCGGNVYRVTPRVAFGQDEHASDFVAAATRWRFGTS
jgi:pyridoxamine 5'-phosphate oxidase-like protein